jgi:hypothetical protein
MPRYYLHVCDGREFREDEEGQDMPSVDAAIAEARLRLRAVLAQELSGGTLNMASFVEIDDEAQQLVTTIQFLDAVEISAEANNRS